MKKLLDWAPVRFGLEVARLYFGRHVSRSAAALAYFLLLSFFPLLICVNAFIGLLRLDVGAVLDAAAAILPRETLGILADYMGYITTNQSPALLLAGAGMTLFSASAAFRTLMRVMEELYGRGGYRGVKRIAASVAFSVLFLLTVYLAVAVLFTGEWLFSWLAGRLELPEEAMPWEWQWFPPAPRPLRRLPGRRGPGGRHRPVLLVHRPVRPVLPGVRLPGLGDHPAGVALPVRQHPHPGGCVQLRLVPPPAGSDVKSRPCPPPLLAATGVLGVCWGGKETISHVR